MIVTNGAAAAQAASASASLRAEAGDTYPFRSHRTVAQVWAECDPLPCIGGVWRMEDERASTVHHEIDGFVFIPLAARVGAAEVC